MFIIHSYGWLYTKHKSEGCQLTLIVRHFSSDIAKILRHCAIIVSVRDTFRCLSHLRVKWPRSLFVSSSSRDFRSFEQLSRQIEKYPRVAKTGWKVGRGRFSLTGRRSEGGWNRVAMQNRSEGWKRTLVHRLVHIDRNKWAFACIVSRRCFPRNVAGNWSEPWPSARFNLQHTPRRISGSNWEKGENRRRRVGERVVDEFL